MIAVINYGAKNDYARMLPERAGDLVVFSHYDIEATDGFAYYEHVPDCEFVPYAELSIMQRAEQVEFSHVITDNEYDLERTARIRARLGLGGQTEASATSFRDKLVMKQVAGRTVRVPRFRGLDHIGDLVAFVAEVGYPVVVKPRKQGGSRDITVLRDGAELERFSRRHWREDLMVEEFVEGSMLHVDAVLGDNYRFVSASRYLRTPLGVLSGVNNGSLQFHPSEPIAKELEAFLDDVLSAFEVPRVSAYHLEVFQTRSGELLLCEIASRVGGARIPAITRASYGLDLLTTWLRLSCDLPVPPVPAAAPVQVHGAVAIVPPGRAVRPPARPPFDWVTDYQVNEQLAADATAQNSTSNLCYAVVSGADSAELEHRLHQVEQWLQDELERPESPHEAARQ
ncbi:MAG: ATP-grasp domain-containing protein [Jatrophihabitans sp.]